MEDNNFPATKSDISGLVMVEQQRAVQEVQAAIIMAKRFPRDQHESFTRIIKSCERINLAKEASYAYPRGGQMVTGPSIRLAEVMAQNWGNLEFGIRELTQTEGESEVQAFAWDLETNVRQTKTFKAPHKRKSKGKYEVLVDPRDIYEYVANMGARRLRACILGIIPGDIVDAAVAKCEDTLKKGDGKPLEDRIREMLVRFEEVGVTKQMIEEKLQHKTTAIVLKQLVELGKIYNSIKDGISKREAWFNVPTVQTSEASRDLTDKLKGAPQTTEKPPDEEPDYKELCKQAFAADDQQMIVAMQFFALSNLPTSKKAAKELWEKYQSITKG